MHWVARIMFSWGIVCVLMTTMTTEWEFFLYRFLLGLCEASLYPVIYSLLIPNWFLPRERAKAISLMHISVILQYYRWSISRCIARYDLLWLTDGEHCLL